LKQNTQAAVGDSALALVHWTRSAKQHNIDSLVKAGDYYLAGLGAVASPENAAACYQAAGESLQSAQALWNLGWMHENGIGIDQDFHLAKRFYDQALEINQQEAYLPVMLSLWKLRWRGWWNTVTRGGIKGIDDGPTKAKRLSLSEWISDFLKADAEMNMQYEADDWDSQYDPMPGGDDGYYDDDIDDDVFVTLLIGGLLAALGWLIWHRQQVQRAAEARRQLEQAAQQGGEQQQPPVNQQQADRGVFPQPGQAEFNDWIAGGVGH
jgi:SEL1 protein